MGGTLRASPTGESALLLNPAGMSLTRSYILSALYQFRASDTGSLVNVSVVDSATKRIAAGLYYSFVYSSPSQTLGLPDGTTFSMEETLMTHEAGLAVSYPLGDILHLGITSKYISVGVEQPDETPDGAVDDGDSGVTMDIGLIVKIMPTLNLGVVYRNAIPMDHPTYPRLLGMGVSYALGTRLLAEFDVQLDFDRAEEVKPSYHGGAELFLATRYALRGGVMHDTLREATYATGGLGLVTKKLGLDFGLRQMVEGGAETLVAFSVRLFVQ
jgi:hypothetical protein